MTAATATYDVLLQDALRLPVEDRSRMASRLIESIDEDDTEMSPAWKTEINRRIESIRAGTARLVPHEEAMGAARQRLAEIRGAHAS